MLSVLPQAHVLMAHATELTSQELIERLGDSETEGRRDAAYELVRRSETSEAVMLAFARAISDKDIQVRFQALLGLARAGHLAEPAIPELVECLRDRDAQVRYRAAHALGSIGAKAMPKLMDFWSEAPGSAQAAAAQSFAILGAEAKAATPLLIQALASDVETLPSFAAEALVALAPTDEALLLQLSAHPDSSVRQVGIAALAAVSNPSETAVREICQAAKDVRPKIRETAIIALTKLELPNADMHELIEAAILDPSEAVQAAALVALRKSRLPGEAFALRIVLRLQKAEEASVPSLIRALGVIGTEARSTLPMLVDAIDERTIDVALLSQTIASFGEFVVADVLAAIEARPAIEPLLSQALAQIGEPATEALLAGMASDSEVIRVAATRALGGIRPLNKPLHDELSKATTDPSPTVRRLAIEALIASDKDHASQRLLLAATQDSAPEVRASAVQALSKFDFPQEQVQNVLELRLQDKHAEVRASTLVILGQLPKFLRQNVARISKLVSDEHASVRMAAVQALGKLDRDNADEAIVQAFVTALAENELSVRISATHAVRQMGLFDAKILDALEANLIDEPELLGASVEAISGFGKKAASLLPVISGLLEHERVDIRVGAIAALAAIDKDPLQLTDRLAVALEDTAWEVRRVAGVELAKLGPDAKAAVPKLFSLLRNREDTDFASAALREINTAPVEAIPLLLESIESDERRIGFYAVSLLGRIGAPAAVALPQLEALLEASSANLHNSRSDFRRKYLLEAIESIQADIQRTE